jgi:septal ring factor EnvC (AmiA/AmiB activator)
MVTALAAQDRERVATHERRLAELAASRQALQAHQQQVSSLRAAAQRAKAAADRAVEARNALVRDIDARRDLNAALASELQGAQQKLQATLTAIAGGAPPDATASLPIGPFRGDLMWPVDGTVRQRFGRGPSASAGIDIAADEGQPVHAVHDGTVAFADTFTGFGRLVIVDHGARNFTLYGNLGNLQVGRGVHVASGDVVGTTGVSPTGAAGLYFELRVDGRAVDPLLWLRKR